MTRRSLRRTWRSLRFRRLQRRLAGPRLLEAFADRHPDAFFVEIGANDGVKHDFLRPFILDHAWRGIMVEPVPYVFERLRSNYRDLERVELENIAIADRDATLPFYYVRQLARQERGNVPGWYDAIGSFSREVVASHGQDIPDLAERIVEMEVPATTFESLCRKHAVTRLDLVLVDAEGYDGKILESIDLATRHPELLVYEHYHLSTNERRQCAERVRSYGYETMEEGFDTWCLDPGADTRMAAVWRRLRPAVPGVSAADDRP